MSDLMVSCPVCGTCVPGGGHFVVDCYGQSHALSYVCHHCNNTTAIPAGSTPIGYVTFQEVNHNFTPWSPDVHQI